MALAVHDLKRIAIESGEAMEISADGASCAQPSRSAALGGGIAYNPQEFEEICKRGLDLSPTRNC